MNSGLIKIQTGSVLDFVPINWKVQAWNEPVLCNQFVKVKCGKVPIVITGEIILPRIWLSLSLKLEIDVRTDKTNCIDLSYLRLINYVKLLR